MNFWRELKISLLYMVIHHFAILTFLIKLSYHQKVKFVKIWVHEILSHLGSKKPFQLFKGIYTFHLMGEKNHSTANFTFKNLKISSANI